MKTLSDNSEVPSRTYYYLLDWNEQDEHETIFSKYGKMSLRELTLSQYKELFKIATNSEMI